MDVSKLKDRSRSIGGSIGNWFGGNSAGFLEGLYSNKIALLIPLLAGIAIAIILKVL